MDHTKRHSLRGSIPNLLNRIRIDPPRHPMTPAVLDIWRNGTPTTNPTNHFPIVLHFERAGTIAVDMFVQSNAGDSSY